MKDYINKIKKMSLPDILTLFMLTSGFIFGIYDFNFLNLMKIALSSLSNFMFTFTYILLLILMSFEMFLVRKKINSFRIHKSVFFSKKPLLIFFVSFQTFCVGGIIGYTVNISNAYIIETVARFN